MKRAYSPDDGPFHQVYVTGYSHSCNEDDLRQHFGQMGTIKEILMKRGFSFVEYKYPEHAAAAVKNLDRSTLKDKPLRVEKSSKYFLF